MPLLDDLYGPERQKAPREQDAERQAKAAAMLADAYDATKATRATPVATATDSFSGLKQKTVDLSSLLQAVGSLPTTNASGASAPASSDATSTPGSSTLNTNAGKTSAGKYRAGYGDAGLRTMAANVASSMGWSQAQFDAWDKLIFAESGWKPTAQNPTSTAYGLGQFLNSTWKSYGSKTSDPATQLRYMAKYIKDRYGDPTKALAFHQSRNYY